MNRQSSILLAALGLVGLAVGYAWLAPRGRSVPAPAPAPHVEAPVAPTTLPAVLEEPPSAAANGSTRTTDLFPSDTLSYEPPTKSKPFDLAKYRLATLKHLHEQFTASAQGSDEEWRLGLELMQESMFAHQDSLGAYLDPAPTTPLQLGGNVRVLRSEGREYHWSASEFPVLAKLLTTAEQDARSPHALSESERTAVLELHRRALHDLTHSN